MAASISAFEAPVTDRVTCPSQSRPIDLVHLGAQTMGDKALEVVVLQLFATQARRALQDMTDTDHAAVVAAAHRLKGAASAVGAFLVADAAQQIEDKGPDAALFARLSAAVLEAEHFILKLCR